MAANWELQLISAVLKDSEPIKAWLRVTDCGIKKEMLSNYEAVTLWSSIEFYYSRPDNFGRVPSPALLTEWFGEVDLPKAEESVDDLCIIIKNKYLDRRVEKALELYTEEKAESAITALQKLNESLAKIQELAVAGGDKSFSQLGLNEIKLDMEMLEEQRGLIGTPWPWPPLNVATGGINISDYILIYALPKSMKTWIGLYIAVFLAATGRSALVYSGEMVWEILRKRIACILARVDYTKFKTGTLSPAEKARVLESLRWYSQECPGDIVFTDAMKPNGEAGGTLDIRRKIETYKPNIVLLDSAYMLEDQAVGGNPLDWKSLALVNRKCKQICKSAKVPMIAILQENERAALKYKGTRGTASLAMNTLAIADCDLAIRAVYNKSKNELSLHLPAARETTQDGFTIHAEAATNFTYKHDHLWEVGDDEEDEQSPRMAGLDVSANAEETHANIEEFGSMIRRNNSDSTEGGDSSTIK